MKFFASFVLFVMLTSSCGNRQNYRTGTAIVRIGEKTLTKEDIEMQIQKGLSESDSVLMAENLARRWAIDILIDDAANKNIKEDKIEIDKLVDDYRRSLVRHRYEEQLVRDKISSSIGSSDKQAYYENNKQQFVLSENLIKGLFLKIPASAPAIDEIRKSYTSKKDEALEKIEKYSLQNAIIYDYFYDKWTNFDDVMEKIPTKFSNPAQFLRINNHLEISDSSFCYFLNISDKLLKGDTAPYNYVEQQIESIILNQRKIDYLRDFGENLYRDAVESGKVKFMKQN